MFISSLDSEFKLSVHYTENTISMLEGPGKINEQPWLPAPDLLLCLSSSLGGESWLIGELEWRQFLETCLPNNQEWWATRAFKQLTTKYSNQARQCHKTHHLVQSQLPWQRLPSWCQLYRHILMNFTFTCFHPTFYWWCRYSSGDEGRQNSLWSALETSRNRLLTYEMERRAR